MFRTLREEIDGIMARDPAARSRFEVVLNYPSFHAMLFHRAARWFWRRRMYLLGRWTSQWGRFWTGIEIHPGA
ncbi:MAG: serine acetyltransferase, partial [Rhodospirillaceae bacterium]|nr:serine acetyltransferase [Rhodospirillaceae bacterium]